MVFLGTHTHLGTQAPSEKTWLKSLPGRNRPLLSPLGPQTYWLKPCSGQALCVSITFMGLHTPMPVKSCTAKRAAGTPRRSISSRPGMEETLWKKPLPGLNQRMSRSWPTEEGGGGCPRLREHHTQRHRGMRSPVGARNSSEFRCYLEHKESVQKFLHSVN